VKIKVTSRYAYTRTEWRRKYSSYPFVTRYYKEIGDQHHFPAALTPGQRRGTHCTGGWVGLGACLDGMENIAPTGIRSPNHPVRKEVAIPTTPFRPSYFTHHHHHQRCRFRAQVLSYVTHSLSDDPAISIFFLRILYPFFHGVDTAVLVLGSGCFPFRLSTKANFVVGSF